MAEAEAETDTQTETGYFSNGIWVQQMKPELQNVQQYMHQSFSYPDLPTQIWRITDKLQEIMFTLKRIEDRVRDVEWELKWKH
jgi:hypothetical protein